MIFITFLGEGELKEIWDKMRCEGGLNKGSNGWGFGSDVFFSLYSLTHDDRVVRIVNGTYIGEMRHLISVLLSNVVEAFLSDIQKFFEGVMS